ncbi:NlpC/P60 family protein [Spongisporangium articulatum]|uniref:NlpC/P60 family protein n=1 Tax=Spongisporangium articulatum TaxID=3362603 RepID=A0ABW8AV26_9ACTN
MQVRVTRRLVTGGICLALVAGSGLTMSTAQAAPTPSVSQVQTRVNALRDQAEVATERYNDAREELKSVQVRLKAAKARLARQRAEVRIAKIQLGQLAAETYKRGNLTTLDLMLSDDPDDALAQAGYLPSLTDRQAGATKRLTLAEAQLAQTTKDIAAEERKAAQAESQMKKTRDTVNAKLAQAQAQLNTLKAAQRRALNRAFSAANAVPAGITCDGLVGGASGRAKTAISFACAQLGDPYVWAAAGPNSWDCSGLTMKAWSAAGVSIPHSSRLQVGYGSRVSLGNLSPGDLVFFGSPIHHVGIYVGDGLMIHAPHTGDVVRVAPVYETPVAAVHLG